MSASNFLQWRLEEVEDSPPNTTLATSTTSPSTYTYNSTSTSTMSAPTPSPEEAGVPKEKTEPVSWDKTLTWENSLDKLKLLKSIGNGKKTIVKREVKI